jgi:hypothetical protein
VSSGRGELKTTGLSQTLKRIQNREEKTEPASKPLDKKRHQPERTRSWKLHHHRNLEDQVMDQ